MDQAPTVTCSKCGLFKSHPNSLYMQPLHDTRSQIVYASPRPPRVLFVIHHPSEKEGKEGYLSDGKEWVMDFLTTSDFEFCVTSLALCWPGTKGQIDGWKPLKPTPKQLQHCSVFLHTLLQEFDPQVVVALGGEPLKALWPADRGPAPNVTKGRLMPVKTSAGHWLVSSYDPALQALWNRSDGKDGMDLTEEYIRLFLLVQDILAGTYKEQQALQWSLIQTPEQLELLCDELDAKGCTKLYVDAETNNWMGSGVHKPKPFREDPNGTLPDKLTIFHPDTQLMCWGVTGVIEEFESTWSGKVEDKVLKGTSYITATILPQAWADDPHLLIRLHRNRVLEAWQMLFDGQALTVLDGVLDVLHSEIIAFPPEAINRNLNCSLDDGWFIAGLRDQSLTNTGLKPTAQQALSILPWDKDLEDAMDRARKSIQERNRALRKKGEPELPELVSMDMVPLEIWAPYNAHDTYEHARTREEKLHAGLLGPDFPWKVYRMLIDGLGWIATLERNGVPIDNELFLQTLDRLEGAETDYEANFQRIPEVVYACKESDFDTFNTQSPNFMTAFVRALHGESDKLLQDRTVPESWPRTKSGRLASDKATLEAVAGEGLIGAVPWDEKTRPQKIWTRVLEWKKAKDDYARLQGLYDYVVVHDEEDGGARIHPSFRMLKTDTEADDDLEASGGAVTGRIVASPNMLNLWERVKPIFRAPRKQLWVCLDYGRIELAWIAWNAQDPLMMAWSNEFKDQHEQRGRAMYEALTASGTFTYVQAWDDCSPEVQKLWRAKGKTQNFATIYMEEPETTARKNLATVDQVIADLELGRQLHPKILELQRETYELCQAGSFVKTCFGRCRSPRLISKEHGTLVWAPSSMGADAFFSLDPNIRQRRNQDNCRIFRSIWNFRGAQSDASDTTFCAGKLIHKLLRGGKWVDSSRVEEVNYQYDALHYLVDEGLVPEFAAKARAVMMDIPNLGLPAEFGLKLPVDVEVGQNLAKSKETPGHLQAWDVERGRYAE